MWMGVSFITVHHVDHSHLDTKLSVKQHSLVHCVIVTVREVCMTLKLKSQNTKVVTTTLPPSQLRPVN